MLYVGLNWADKKHDVCGSRHDQKAQKPAQEQPRRGPRGPRSPAASSRCAAATTLTSHRQPSHARSIKGARGRVPRRVIAAA